MANLKHIIARLRSQFERGEPVLFTGAGFSTAAKCPTGETIPTSGELKDAFWQLAFPATPPEPTTRLGDAFYAASVTNRSKLSQLIQRRLSVDSESLPSFYKQWFSMPWSRCYTLNIDDIELAAMRRYQLGQNVTVVSATSGRRDDTIKNLVDQLDVVHLNGLVGDSLPKLMFSSMDYGSRQASPDEWMIQAVNDIVTRPVIFVGTQLDEPTLWQYLEHRRQKGTRGTRELRPGSILVSPFLDPARRIVLREFHVDWVKMDAAEFAEVVLSSLSSTIEIGRSALRSKRQSVQRTLYPPLVSELAAQDSAGRTDYLLGQEPQWVDLVSGRAIERSCDPEIFATAEDILSGNILGRPLVLTGTAGSGKSTSLMRLALRMSAKGISTYWLDERSNIDVYRLRDLVNKTQDPIAILADDADIFGRVITGWARELPQQRAKVLFGCAVRATKVDGLVDQTALAGVAPIEIGMPLLEDHDIDNLISVLDAENRLGILKGKSLTKRRAAFRQQAGRQLLVGMLQATSGERFSEKAVQEFDHLMSTSRILYGVICLVHSQRYTLSLDEVLTAVGSGDNETLNTLDRLVNRGLVTRDDRYTGYRSRHRVIAEQVVNSAVYRSECHTIMTGIFTALASTLRSTEPRTSRLWRRFIRFINHEFVLRVLAPEDARLAYEAIEGFMNWDYHFWLQRGSLEVQEGDLDLATNYLGQALSLAPGDKIVQSSWSYLLMKKAARRPNHIDAESWFSEGFETITTIIDDKETYDPHPYHILGSQTIAWVHSATLSVDEERYLLQRALGIVKLGLTKNPRNSELQQLADDLLREWLMTAVSPAARE